jgi:3-phenylpropionate/trans-cinnamate dioxygenase ferredoxin subunit
MSEADPAKTSAADSSSAAASEVHLLCRRDELAPGSAKRFDVEGLGIALVRVGDDFHAIGDRCSHANYSLADGEVHSGDCHLECFKHGSRFSLITGKPDVFPATQPVPVYEITIDGDDVKLVLP